MYSIYVIYGVYVRGNCSSWCTTNEVAHLPAMHRCLVPQNQGYDIIAERIRIYVANNQHLRFYMWQRVALFIYDNTSPNVMNTCVYVPYPRTLRTHACVRGSIYIHTYIDIHISYPIQV